MGKFDESTLNEEPLVSVIIPVWNTAKYLPDCLSSVIRQTYRRIEIICIDDGSTDESPGILSEFASRDARIRIVTQENQGLSSSRNRGISLAEGEFILFLDSDDMLTTEAVQILVRQAKASSSDAIFFQACEFADGDEETGEPEPLLNHTVERKRVMTGIALLEQLEASIPWDPRACLIFLRKHFLLQNNLEFFPRLLHEDNLFTLQVILRSNQVTLIRERLYLNRIRLGSITRGGKTRQHIWGLATTIDVGLNEIESLLDQDQADARAGGMRVIRNFRSQMRVTWSELSPLEKMLALVTHHRVSSKKCLGLFLLVKAGIRPLKVSFNPSFTSSL
jgi:hypothetical protein